MDINLDFNDRFIETGSGRMHVKVHDGTRPTLIFLHGLGANVKSWTRLVRLLPPTFTIYLVDLIGHGDSDAPEINYGLEVQLDAIRDLVTSDGIRNPCLFGHSYGGLIAARYAISNRVERLILEDSAGLRSQFLNTDKEKMEKKKETLIKNAALWGTKEYVTSSILDDEVAGPYLMDGKDLDMIKVPTLIIWGEKDDLIDPRFSSEFAGAITGSRLVMVKDAMHVPHYTHPQEVADALISFLES